MIALAAWQGLLNGLGWVLARIYDTFPNYGLAIIVLTVLIRVLLLPLGIKQIRSMQHMQLIQPKIKQIQQKYKGNKAKQQEETMKLYKEYGVNPFSGCWPTLLQFPILIAMYSVVRFPQYPMHIPASSALSAAVLKQFPEPSSGATRDLALGQLPGETRLVGGRYVVPKGSPRGTDFLSMNLLCTPQQAGQPTQQIPSKFTIEGRPVVYEIDCGSGVPTRIPYYAVAVLMFGTTYVQQRQMQKASPPGAASQQQQALMKVMPLMFGVFGIFFPAGLILYWTTSNAWQIGQQYFMLKSRPTAETLATRANQNPKSERRGFMSAMMQRAEQQRSREGGQQARRNDGGKTPGQRPKPGGAGGSGRTGGTGGPGRKKRPKR